MRERNIVTSIIFTIVTCGIYGLIWFVQMTDDAANVSGDDSMSGGKALLFTLITCGIYQYYWAYKMGKMIASAGKKDNSVLFVFLHLFGLGIVNYCLMQAELNDLVA